ncbi:hypothetical protein F0562_031053 [Nyssa sinensis]|uniref:Uncharacterized protein n=1 Tax=Nyssa sinensis TaxID=561372 RepID=A0A5J5AR35_9ASTE|nr:hypothetical protein F0562_031053 [Nyssa sinensis]
MMAEDVSKNGVLAVQTLRNNIMASTVMASMAIMLSSVIAVLMTNGGGYREAGFVYGDKSDYGLSVKYFAILVCFLLAFLFDVQSIRYYSHASILINVPLKKMSSHNRHSRVTHEYVGRTVNRGKLFLVSGFACILLLVPSVFVDLRTYSYVPLLPCPWFSCCYFLDVTFDFGCVADAEEAEEENNTVTTTD